MAQRRVLHRKSTRISRKIINTFLYFNNCHIKIIGRSRKKSSIIKCVACDLRAIKLWKVFSFWICLWRLFSCRTTTRFIYFDNEASAREKSWKRSSNGRWRNLCRINLNNNFFLFWMISTWWRDASHASESLEWMEMRRSRSSGFRLLATCQRMSIELSYFLGSASGDNKRINKSARLLFSFDLHRKK